MSRLFGATLLATAQGAPVVSFFCVNSCNDGTQPSYCVTDKSTGCETPPAGCNLMAFQTLYNEGTCEAFQASRPVCFGEGHGVDSGRCPEAAAFQLVMDRNRDLGRTYSVHDFNGVAENLYQPGAVFTDSTVKTDIADVYKDWSSEEVSVYRVPRKVLGRNSTSGNWEWSQYELGSWVEGGDISRYTHWSYSGDPFGWQIETDVDLRETENQDESSDYADAIRERYAVYSSLYEAGNFSGLAAELYTSDAILALTTGTFVEHDSLEDSLSQFYNDDPHRAFSVSSAVGKDGVDVVHDIGTVSTTSQRYYARWEKCGDEWKIAVHVHAVTHPPPPADASCASHPACSALAGNCCPDDQGLVLDCCGASAACSAHPGCASLGLDGDCCPDTEGLTLECCSASVLV